MLKPIVAAVLALAAVPAAAATTTLTFNAAAGTARYLGGAFSEAGYTLTASSCNSGGCFTTMGTAANSLDPTGAALGNAVRGATLTLARTDGGAFTLDSADFALQNNEMFVTNADLNLVFRYADGGVSGDYRVLDLDPSAAVSRNSFSDFGTRQLTSISFQADNFSSTGYLQLDNLKVSTAAPVPEPGEWAMMAAGLGVAGLAARRRRRA